MSSFDDQREDIYAQLNAIVERILDVASEDEGIRYISSGYLLILGYDFIDDEGDIVGDVAVYPKDGSQPAWKSLGMMHRAIDLQKERS